MNGTLCITGAKDNKNPNAMFTSVMAVYRLSAGKLPRNLAEKAESEEETFEARCYALLKKYEALEFAL